MTVKIVFAILIYICAVKFAKSNFTGFIVGGEYAKIENYPYSVYVSKKCSNISASCGASILNQVILLTAAHCVIKCLESLQRMNAYVGSEVKYKGIEINVVGFKMHEHYDVETKANDIALLKLEKALPFGKKVKRVALVEKMPKTSTAIIAGWGWIDSVGTRGDLLKDATQDLIDQETCSGLLGGIPLGTICGKDQTSYPEKGDSGSALIVDHYIQIGLVSFKKRDYTNDTIVYTDVTYFYDWIMKNSADLNCDSAGNSTPSHIECKENCSFGQGLVV